MHICAYMQLSAPTNHPSTKTSMLLPVSFSSFLGLRSSKALLFLGAGMAFACVTSPSAQAASIAVPNYSFENPTDNLPGFPVNTELANWIDTPQPADYAQPVPWGFGTGNFPNPDVGVTGHYAVMDGTRAGYILINTGLGFYQELTSPDGIFTVGEAYQLTVGVSAEDGTTPGSVLSLILYYRDLSNNVVPIGTPATVGVFPDTDTFVDFTTTTPVVQSTDAWAGKPIGIMIEVTNGPAPGNGGYDVDNVRLNSVPEPSAGLLGGLGLAWAGAVRRRNRRG